MKTRSEGGVANVRFDVCSVHKSQVDGFTDVGRGEDNDIGIPLQAVQLCQKGIHCSHKPLLSVHRLPDLRHPLRAEDLHSHNQADPSILTKKTASDQTKLVYSMAFPRRTGTLPAVGSA